MPNLAKVNLFFVVMIFALGVTLGGILGFHQTESEIGSELAKNARIVSTELSKLPSSDTAYEVKMVIIELKRANAVIKRHHAC